MSKYFDDIRDDEFQVIGGWGQTNPHNKKRRKRIWRGILLILLLLALFAVASILLFTQKKRPKDPEGVFEGSLSLDTTQQVVVLPVDNSEQILPLIGYTERKDTVVNDIELFVLTPRNAVPSLTIGRPDNHLHQSVVLALQAADIRKDTGGIMGAFVMNGKLCSKGDTRTGFCAILDGKITIGMAESTPLFEEAIEKDGFFFRQYPLVSEGVLINSGSKGKSIRKALCSKGGQVFVVISESEESFHDFSQALVDMGIEEAIYLCGGRLARGWYKDIDGLVTSFGDQAIGYKNESYLVWR